MPCPDVAAPAYQLPERAKSALVDTAVVTEQVTFGSRRVNGTVPVRPEPSVKVYDSSTAGARRKAQVAVPTACALVAGGALKLPPLF